MTAQKTRGVMRKIGIKLIALAMIILGLAFLTDLSLRPIVETVNAYECKAAVTSIINNAVGAELEREDVDYSRLVNLTTNDGGDVISVESNVVGINRLKNCIAKRIERELSRMPASDIEIPIGTLTGVQLLHGKGFPIGMTIKPMGYATTSIISEFTEAGINQTRHRIVVQIQTDVDAIVPGFATQVSISTDIVAAETIIVGRVPEAYTHVVSTSSELVGTLEDYGATLPD